VTITRKKISAMRVIISIFLILNVTLSIAQAKTAGDSFALEVDPAFNTVTIRVKTNSGSQHSYRIQITDSNKNIVKTVELPEIPHQTESIINILDLGPGNYTCFVYLGEAELYKKDFFKESVFMEPQTQPVIKNNQKK
jgi:hypothetical protein